MHLGSHRQVGSWVKDARLVGPHRQSHLPRLRYALGGPLLERGPHRSLRPAHHRSSAGVATSASTVPQVSLLQPIPVEDDNSRPLLVYFPGTDCTGNAIAPQLPGLIAAGFDVRSLYISITNRQDWERLLADVLVQLRALVASRPAGRRKLTLVAESFGGCLALRLAVAAPDLLERMVLVNPATCFAKSYGGLSSLVAATNLLSLFPAPLYQAAQAVMIPLLLDPEKVGRNTVGAIKSMMIMTPPPNYKAGEGFVTTAPGRQQLGGPSGFQLYLPAATASWRARMLRSGDVPDAQLATIRTPTLVVASAEDRMLPSLTEAARLVRVMPAARRLVLPSSGHTALLEESVNLADILRRTGFMPQDQPPADVASQTSAQQLRSGAAYRLATDASSAPLVGTNGSAAVMNDAAASVATATMVAARRQASNGGQSGISERVGTNIGSSEVTLAGERMNRQPDSGNRTNGMAPGDARSSLPGSTAALSSNGAGPPDSYRSGTSGAPRTLNSSNGASRSSGDGRPPPKYSSSGNRAEESVAQQQGDTLLWPSDAAAPAAEAITAGPFSGDAGAEQSVLQSQIPDSAAAVRFAGNTERSPSDQLRADATAMAGSAAESAAPSSGSNGRQSSSPSSSNNSSNSKHGAGIRDGVRNGSPAERADSEASRMRSAQHTGWDAVDDAYDEGGQRLTLLRTLISPLVSGTEHLPDPLGPKRPILFVGNHTLYGVYDLPFLLYELYIRGFKARGLAHPGHWLGPAGAVFERYGAVKASPRAAYRLLRDKEAVLLFPGGGREVTKRKGEAYQLHWKESPDFVRLAAKLGAVIVPFAALGADDAFDLAMDTDEILASPVLGALARNLVARVDPDLDPAESVFPISKLPVAGLPSLVPIPKLNRLYFRFMPAVDTAEELRDVRDSEQCLAVYRAVKARVEEGLGALQAERDTDPERHLPARLLGQARRMLPAFDLMRDVIQ